MKSNITEYDISNTIRMTRSLHKGTILVLEGDSDSRVYENFIGKSNCMIIPAHNKDNAIKALEILENDGFTGILVIVDADFWHVVGLRFIFGNRKSKTITAEILEGLLRITYEYTDFCITKLYKAIKEWGKRNSPFKVLKD